MPVYVVGIDGSETAAKAARRAGDLARETNADIHVVCAYQSGRGSTVRVDGELYAFSGLNVAEETAEAQSAAYRASGLSSTYAVAEGKPAAVILHEAERLGADLIVVGNRRVQGATRILGAVANDIIRHAPCDVLLVKTV